MTSCRRSYRLQLSQWQTCYLKLSQCTETGPTSPDVWQASHHNTQIGRHCPIMTGVWQAHHHNTQIGRHCPITPGVWKASHHNTQIGRHCPITPGVWKASHHNTQINRTLLPGGGQTNGAWLMAVCLLVEWLLSLLHLMKWEEGVGGECGGAPYI